MDTIEFHAVVGQDQVIRPPAGVELPRGEVEVTVRARPSEAIATAARVSPSQLRAMPRAERQAILAAAAALAEEAGSISSQECNPTSDLRGSEHYKRAIVRTLVKRAAGKAYERALTHPLRQAPPRRSV